MRAFSLRRRPEETVVVAFMIVLFGLGLLGALFGGFAAGDGSVFWRNFVAGVVLLVLMTLPIWFLQRWRALGRPIVAPERAREARWMGLAVFLLWLAGLGIAAAGLLINVNERASLEANAAVSLLIAYLVGWGVLVFRVLGRPPALVGRLRARLLGARTK